MLAYAILMFLIAALLAALGIAVYGGRTELIHRYRYRHRPYRVGTEKV